jgi:hypothetical protein
MNADLLLLFEAVISAHCLLFKHPGAQLTKLVVDYTQDMYPSSRENPRLPGRSGPLCPLKRDIAAPFNAVCAVRSG